jgi:hypothetical protein
MIAPCCLGGVVAARYDQLDLGAVRRAVRRIGSRLLAIVGSTPSCVWVCSACLCFCVCVVGVWACVRACVRVCVRVGVCVRVCVRV